MFQLDKIKYVEAIEPQAGASISGKCLSMKNIIKMHIVVQITQAASNTVAITIEQSTDVSKSGNTAITQVVPIWSNLDTDTSDVLVKRTNAVSYTTDSGVQEKIIVFEVDAQKLDAGYTSINVLTGSSSSANITSALYICELRYSGADLDAD